MTPGQVLGVLAVLAGVAVVVEVGRPRVYARTNITAYQASDLARVVRP